MDIPFAYRKTTKSTQAPTENPWVRPYQGTSTSAARKVIANISVVAQIRGDCSRASGCDSAGLVFDMGYLWDTERGRNVARPASFCSDLGQCGRRVTIGGRACHPVANQPVRNIGAGTRRHGVSG